MEMDLFVTPEKQRNHPSSVSLGKTPVRRKLIVDDDNNEAGSEKKGQSRTSGGGLRQFSVMVCQKLEAKKITTYKEVADEIISDFATIKQNAEKPLNDNEYNEKNIRRRVYDALNVFMALDIIARDKKEIRWKGLPITCKKDVEEVKMDRNKIMNSVQKKAAFLKELREKVSSLESLMSRNKEMVVKTEGPAEGFTLPFILLETNPHAVVEIEISEDMQLVHLDFNRWNIPTVQPPSDSRGKNDFLWCSGQYSFASKFSSKSTWNLISEPAPLVSWSKIVWFREQIPRCSFVCWMVMLNRLPTKDRLISWGMSVPLLCSLCSLHPEFHDHLFFSCVYSVAVLSHFSGWMFSTPPLSLVSVAHITDQAHIVSCSGAQSIIKLLMQVVVYSLWRERNHHIFRQTSSSEAATINGVDRSLRDRFLSLPPPSEGSISLLMLYLSIRSSSPP